MSTRRYGLLVLTGAALSIAACGPTVTAESVQKIKVCTTTYAEVKDLVGKPDEIGQVAGHVTWRYNSAVIGDKNGPPRLILMFDNGTVVSDLAYNPPGIIELKSRCGKN
jgi:hypothetical protein